MDRPTLLSGRRPIVRPPDLDAALTDRLAWVWAEYRRNPRQGGCRAAIAQVKAAAKDNACPYAVLLAAVHKRAYEILAETGV